MPIDVYPSLGDKPPNMHANDAFTTPTKEKIDEVKVH
jgi:hypothetical protein